VPFLLKEAGLNPFLWNSHLAKVVGLGCFFAVLNLNSHG